MLDVRRWFTHPALAVSATLLAGVVEMVALARSQHRQRRILRRRRALRPLQS